MRALADLGVDLQGVSIVDGVSARFDIVQYPDNRRSVVSRLGVTDHAEAWDLPAEYTGARHFHLATMPLVQQRNWLVKLRGLPGRPRISVDMFENNAAEDPVESRRLCAAADLAFMNEDEWRTLFAGRPAPNRPVVIKRGGQGATYCDQVRQFGVAAPSVEVVDTTGAGEVFAGVMLSLLLADAPLESALRHATEVASAKVSEFGVDGPNFTTALQRVAAA